MLERYKDGGVRLHEDGFYINFFGEYNPINSKNKQLSKSVIEVVESIVCKMKEPVTVVSVLHIYMKTVNGYINNLIIRKALDELVVRNVLEYKNTELGRIYNLNKTDMIKVSASKLVRTIEDNSGKLMSILFKKTDGETRVANGIFKGRTDLGNIQFQEYKYLRAKKNGTLDNHPEYHEYTQIIPKSIIEVRVAKQVYRIK